METKFCYFNNYNVNQPRHFCKGCQRYWTAGGALRNVPVGAGRRKNKPPGRGGPGGYSEECLFDGSGGVIHQFELDGVVLEELHLATTHGGFRQVFPVKRRRSGGSGGQNCWWSWTPVSQLLPRVYYVYKTGFDQEPNFLMVVLCMYVHINIRTWYFVFDLLCLHLQFQ
jgi:hypothetical protein